MFFRRKTEFGSTQSAFGFRIVRQTRFASNVPNTDSEGLLLSIGGSGNDGPRHHSSAAHKKRKQTAGDHSRSKELFARHRGALRNDDSENGSAEMSTCFKESEKLAHA